MDYGRVGEGEISLSRAGAMRLLKLEILKIGF